jgi:glucokinase
MTDAAHLRRLNLERVLAAAMTRQGAFTRAELIEMTGLSAPTVGSLTSSLIRAGLLVDLGAGPSRGGRRPSHMEFNARHGFVAGIDIGPTRTRVGIADLRGELIARRIVQTPLDRNPDHMLAAIAQELTSLMKDTEIPACRLLCAAAGVPGVVDPCRGVVILSPNLKGWSDVPMAEILADALQTRVLVENDVNLAVTGEHWKGAARGHDTCAFLSFGTGIGAGVLVDGRLHHGHHFLAGEIGLMCMGPQFVKPESAIRGSLEAIAGLEALKARWQAAQPGDGDWIAELFEAAKAGDRSAQQTLDDAATFIGIAAANVCSVLDPSLVVLGGALLAGGALLEPVRQIVSRFIPMPSAIVTTSLDKDAPLWGSLLVAMREARERLRNELGQRRPAAAALHDM